MPATYEIISRETGRVLFVQPLVLDPVRLTGCSMTSGSSVLTVSSTTALHPGMGVECSGIPRGAFIASILDATKVKLALSLLDSVSKKWTTTEEAAEAVSSVENRTAIFTGHPLRPVAGEFSVGVYRDEFESTQANPIYSAFHPGVGLGAPVPYQAGLQVSDGYVDDGALIALNNAKSRLDDPTMHVPPRHLTESWSEWLFVCTGGHIAHVLADPEMHSVRLKEITA